MSDTLRPDWALPAGVQALITLRSGASAADPYGLHNLAAHVGDNPQRVAANRAALLQATPGLNAVQWLNQIHGVDAVQACGGSVVLTADAQFTSESGLACAVLTADCLPVLFCAEDGSQVAAAHAGWRGLAGGVLLNTLRAFADPAQVLVYLGPAIGPDVFEVGPEVREAFHWAPDSCFKPGRGDRLLADIYALARHQLLAAGVMKIAGGEFCTVSDERFYSYRREAKTGRMASLIWRQR